ncbi:MAG: glycosyltransferase family 2 protein [Methylophilus sp.]|nr:glycosyltransferase family 2 protein [Methylophilus sp.]
MIHKKSSVTLSVVSHLQQQLVGELLDDLEKYAKDDISVTLTLNVDEALTFKTLDYTFPIHIIRNAHPKGFGANHNQAFTFCDTPYFCIINPDIRLLTSPFSILISELEKHSAALIGPKVINPEGGVEDSVRKFPTPLSILKKIAYTRKIPDYPTDSTIINPDWVGGMFMLFKSEKFKAIGGFDERYFLYYEDVDICRSLHEVEHSIIYSPNTSVIHEARRSSHKSIKYLKWHLKSMLLFFIKWTLMRHFRTSP